MPQTTSIGITQLVDESEFPGRSAKNSTAQDDLVASYDQLLAEKRLGWTTNLRIARTLGSGGQGTVYLATRTGSDEFTMPRAVKVFSPEHYRTPDEYDSDMARVGRVAARVARIQDDHLLAVEHFFCRDRIRIMVMEWIEGFDLRRLVTSKMYGVTKDRVSKKRWERLNEQVVTAGPVQPRLQPAVVMSIIRDGLRGLAALHDEQIIHGDIKPANMMMKRTGHAKIIDIGSGIEQDCKRPRQACTPSYASPTVLDGNSPTEPSDLVSLGYVAVELLTGRCLFSDVSAIGKLIEQKLALPEVLEHVLPTELEGRESVVNFCQDLLHAEQLESSAEDLLNRLQENFGNGDYGSQLRIWIEELIELEDLVGDC